MQQSYQIIVMGQLDSRIDALKSAVIARAVNLGISPTELTFLTDSTFDQYDKKKPAMGIYFGHSDRNVSPFLKQILQDSILVAPVVTSLDAVNDEIPDELKHINAIEVASNETNVTRLTSLVFETFRLLRKERGIFISYRRIGSQPLADLLYEELDKRGFDVFIDVRSVPPAVDFQAELWHRMSDVDVIVLIDTPGFREGRWTSAELAQANLLGIQTLHLLWPGQTEDSNYSFSRFLKLGLSDFSDQTPGQGASITVEAIGNICDRAEELRAEAMALRHAHLIDYFCDLARDLALNPTVQPQRWISVDISKKSLAVVPAVGRPTSDRINAIFDSISEHKGVDDEIWIIYDSRGLHPNWLKHLSWLDSHLPVRTISMKNALPALQGHLI